jgi:hypothetical protein
MKRSEIRELVGWVELAKPNEAFVDIIIQPYPRVSLASGELKGIIPMGVNPRSLTESDDAACF